MEDVTRNCTQLRRQRNQGQSCRNGDYLAAMSGITRKIDRKAKEDATLPLKRIQSVCLNKHGLQKELQGNNCPVKTSAVSCPSCAALHSQEANWGNFFILPGRSGERWERADRGRCKEHFINHLDVCGIFCLFFAIFRIQTVHLFGMGYPARKVRISMHQVHYTRCC